MDNTVKLDKTKNPGGFLSHEYFKHKLILM